MNTKKIENVISMPVEERYDYFIRKVAEFKEVWSIGNENGWALLNDNENRIIVPFWPEKEFALLCCSEQWTNYTPKLIMLNDFMSRWLPGMKNDNRFANVFYTPTNRTGSIVEPDTLLQDINDEEQNYL